MSIWSQPRAKTILKYLWIFSALLIVWQIYSSYSSLPERLATHFDSSGNPNGWSSSRIPHNLVFYHSRNERFMAVIGVFDAAAAQKEIRLECQHPQQGLLAGHRRAGTGMQQAHERYDVWHCLSDQHYDGSHLPYYYSKQR